MSRKPNSERVQCQSYAWILRRRNGMCYADGRSNPVNLDKHSLETRDRKEAGARLRQLDLVKAVENNLADASLLSQDRESLLSLDEGGRLCREHARRPAIRGGMSLGAHNRYRTALDKFLRFAEAKGPRHWRQVDKAVLDGHDLWLEENDCHDKTQHTELTVLKQILKWMAGEKRLPPSSLFRYPLQKPSGASTYCHTHAGVRAIVGHCRTDRSLNWPGDVVVALAQTGLRISELASLRWPDVGMDRWVITLADTTRRSRKSERPETRTTKSHRDRSPAVRDDLKTVLRSLTRYADHLVFHGAKGGKIKPDKLRRALINRASPALASRFPAVGGHPGITAGRVHRIRHYFCSCSADTGVPEQMPMSWPGHRESEMIRHYYHQRSEESQRPMGRLPSHGGEDSPSAGDESGRTDLKET